MELGVRIGRAHARERGDRNIHAAYRNVPAGVQNDGLGRRPRRAASNTRDFYYIRDYGRPHPERGEDTF